MRRMSFHRSNSGMATVLGTLIFVGILFTCAIPFYLRINQANTYYTQVVDEMRRFDEKRGMEDIDVYAFNYTVDQLKVYIKNRCSLEVRIVSIWINTNYSSILENGTILAMGDYTFGPFNVTLPSESGETWDYVIKVMTSRGNVFSSLTNPLLYTEGEGWSGSTALSFNIVIYGPWFYRYVIIITGPNSFYYENQVRIPLFGESTMVKVDVTDLGIHHINITREWQGYKLLINRDYDITVDNPSVWVYASDT